MFLYETQLRVWPQAMTLLRDIQNCIASTMWFFLRVDTGRWTVQEKPGHRRLLGRWQRTSRERYGRVGLHLISRGWHGDSLLVAMETDEPITLHSLGLNMGFKGIDRLRTPYFCALPRAVLACGRSYYLLGASTRMDNPTPSELRVRLSKPAKSWTFSSWAVHTK